MNQNSSSCGSLSTLHLWWSLLPPAMLPLLKLLHMMRTMGTHPHVGPLKIHFDDCHFQTHVRREREFLFPLASRDTFLAILLQHRSSTLLLQCTCRLYKQVVGTRNKCVSAQSVAFIELNKNMKHYVYNPFQNEIYLAHQSGKLCVASNIPGT